jgi:hypothetical protein
MPDVYFDERLRLELNGRVRRLRVVGRSPSSPGFWLCEDLESGRVLYLHNDKLRADACHDDFRSRENT